jgi:hypothetical protein
MPILLPLFLILYNRYYRPGKVLVKYLFSAGNSLFPRIFYTYKPYEGCHRCSHRRDGTPSHAVFSPPIAAGQPRSPLLPETCSFPVQVSSSRPSSLDLCTPRIDSITRVSGPPRPTSGFEPPSSPLNNTLTHTTSVTSSVHRHTSPFSKPCHMHWSATSSSFSSSCNFAGKHALHQSDPPTGPHQARRLTTRHPPHTPTALPAHYTKQGSSSTMISFLYRLLHALVMDRIDSPTLNTHRKSR